MAVAKTLFSVRLPTTDYAFFCAEYGKELLGDFLRKCLHRAVTQSAFCETVLLNKPMLSVKENTLERK